MSKHQPTEDDRLEIVKLEAERDRLAEQNRELVEALRRAADKLNMAGWLRDEECAREAIAKAAS